MRPDSWSSFLHKVSQTERTRLLLLLARQKSLQACFSVFCSLLAAGISRSFWCLCRFRGLCRALHLGSRLSGFATRYRAGRSDADSGRALTLSTCDDLGPLNSLRCCPGASSPKLLPMLERLARLQLQYALMARNHNVAAGAADMLSLDIGYGNIVMEHEFAALAHEVGRSLGGGGADEVRGIGQVFQRR